MVRKGREVALDSIAFIQGRLFKICSDIFVYFFMLNKQFFTHVSDIKKHKKKYYRPH